MTSSAFSVSALYPENRFEVTKGTPVIGGLRSASLPHFFCPASMSWLFTRPGGLPGLVNILCTLLDDGAETLPFIETCVSERLAWATTPAAHAFAQFPSPDQWPGLLAAYAAEVP
jgi:hypothetical protein